MTTVTKKAITLWFSKIVLKIIPDDIKDAFRKYERQARKLLTAHSHRKFNETCLNNNLLPIYSNIIIYIYSIK